ncbi:MAG: hypothetical protein M1839_009370 [Geoglossum umbratile]|nr:MAG: hypothetical protein M1839_009370 [Geoglossum umbratile]
MPSNTFGHTPDWERYRGVIKRLYLIENSTQNKVRETLKREYGLTITESQLKKQLDKWDLAAKNVKLNPKEKAALLQLQEGRQQQENKRTEFRRWKKFVDPRTFTRFKGSLEGRKISLFSLIDNSGAFDLPLLDGAILNGITAVRLSGVSYRTPSLSGTCNSRVYSVNSSHHVISRRGTRVSSATSGSRAPSGTGNPSHPATTVGGSNRVPPRTQTDRRWRTANIAEIVSKYMPGLNGPTGPGGVAGLEVPDPTIDSPISPTEKLFNEFINPDMLQHDPEYMNPTQLTPGHIVVSEEKPPGDEEFLPIELEELLALSIEEGNGAKVQDFLSREDNPKIRTRSRSTALRLATQYGQEQIVNMLLDGGADLTTCQQDGLLPLQWAIVIGQQEIAKILILRGANPNGKSQAGQTPLQLAIRGGWAATVDMLLQSGADVRASDCCQWTSLHIAIRWGVCTQILIKLLDYGADVNAKNDDSNTPLHFAANWGTASTMQALLGYGADVGAENRFHLTPLQRAVSSARDATIAASLLEHGADGNLRFPDGSTALHKAVFLGANDTVQLLLMFGVDPTARCRLGQTPLDIAVSYGNSDAVKLLIDHDKGAAARAILQGGLLREALKYQRFPIAKLLLENAIRPMKSTMRHYIGRWKKEAYQLRIFCYKMAPILTREIPCRGHRYR